MWCHMVDDHQEEELKGWGYSHSWPTWVGRPMSECMSATKSAASRVGLGEVRRLEVKFMWPQDVVKNKRLGLCNMKEIEIPAEPGRKSRSKASMWKRCR